MSINYYHNIEVTNQGEQLLSLWKKLDNAGTSLIGSQNVNYSGTNVNVYPETYSVSFSPVTKYPEISTCDKIKVAVGIALKKIAAFFSGEVKAKYELVSKMFAGQSSFNELKGLFDQLKTTREVSIKKEGCDDDLAAACCAGMCLGAALTAQPTYYRPYCYRSYGYYRPYGYRW